MIANAVPWEESKRRLLADPETRAAYDALEDRYQLTRRLIRIRLEAGLTQAQVARRMGVTQGRVAQIESLNSTALPSLTSIRRFAAACGQQPVIGFEPLAEDSRASTKSPRALKVAERRRRSYAAKAKPRPRRR